MHADNRFWWCFVDEYYEKEIIVTGVVYVWFLCD